MVKHSQSDEPLPRWALVTGGTGDIGRAITISLARDAGLRVVVLDLDEDAAGSAIAEELAATAGVSADRVRYCHGDIRDRDALGRAMDVPGRLELVVANAGMVAAAPFLAITDEQWDAHLQVNLTGSFRTAQVAAQTMKAAGTSGQIVFTGSWVADRTWPEITAYAVTKSAIQTLTRQIARELAPHGIRANLVSPGIVAAGMARHQLKTEPQYAARANKSVPLGRFQEPEEVAAVVSFLASRAGDYLTGSTLVADGGASLGPAL